MLETEEIDVNKLKPYEKNSKRHTKKQIEHIKNSIKEFGFLDPIGIDENNMILEGHGRYQALKQLGYKKVPCVRITGLTEEQKKAYVIVHNSTNKETGFDFPILENELLEIPTIDMNDFGLEFNPDKLFKVNERIKTNNAYNLQLVDINRNTDNFWQMPIIHKVDYVPSELIGFNYAKTYENKAVGIHFYIDDYQFERIWNKPEDYVDILREYECVLTPDFSLYMDMPMPMKIWNIYRSRQIGQYLQDEGLIVIPTLSWAEPETFEFCFEGLEQGGTVSISTVGVKQNKEALKIWKQGTDEAIKRLKPNKILLYGGKVDYDFGDIEVHYYENKVTEKFKEV